MTLSPADRTRLRNTRGEHMEGVEVVTITRADLDALIEEGEQLGQRTAERDFRREENAELARKLDAIRALVDESAPLSYNDDKEYGYDYAMDNVRAALGEDA